ncbi:MAG: hypothetical protein K1Y36_01085 [Blastocatellia bacterium]|nr:hypothetical protein [Blastocatellia bacterium]
MNFTTHHFFSRTGVPVRNIVPSPNGSHLALVADEWRKFGTDWGFGAWLFRREGHTFVNLGELPVAAHNLMVLDDGTCFTTVRAYEGVEVVRCDLTGQGLTEAARWVEIQGSSLLEPLALLLPSGFEALLMATDRDDGHGWSEPVYTDLWRHLELPSGRRLREDYSPFGRAHVLPAPGAPWASPFDGGNREALKKCLRSLPLGFEEGLRVGPTRLLTNARVLDVATGETVFGEKKNDRKPGRVLYDLSPNEQHLLAADETKAFELWNLADQSCLRLPLAAQKGSRCAGFLAGGDIVVGTMCGDGILLKMS